MARRKAADKVGMDILKSILSRADGTLEIPVGDLYEIDGNIDHAVSFLADFIGRKMEEEGFDSLDDANEGSRDLSALLFLLGIIEDAGFVTARHVELTLAATTG